MENGEWRMENGELRGENGELRGEIRKFQFNSQTINPLSNMQYTIISKMQLAINQLSNSTIKQLIS